MPIPHEMIIQEIGIPNRNKILFTNNTVTHFMKIIAEQMVVDCCSPCINGLHMRNMIMNGIVFTINDYIMQSRIPSAILWLMRTNEFHKSKYEEYVKNREELQSLFDEHYHGIYLLEAYNDIIINSFERTKYGGCYPPKLDKNKKYYIRNVKNPLKIFESEIRS